MVDTRRKKEEKIQQTTIYGNDALAFFPDKNSLLLKKKIRRHCSLSVVLTLISKTRFCVVFIDNLVLQRSFFRYKTTILQNLAKSPHFKYRQKLFIYSSFIVIYFANF